MFSVILYKLRQTVGNRAPPLLFPSFSSLTLTFPKLSVILRPLCRIFLWQLVGSYAVEKLILRKTPLMGRVMVKFHHIYMFPAHFSQIRFNIILYIRLCLLGGLSHEAAFQYFSSSPIRCGFRLPDVWYYATNINFEQILNLCVVKVTNFLDIIHRLSLIKNTRRFGDWSLSPSCCPSLLYIL
jgi:hypothetical protein